MLTACSKDEQKPASNGGSGKEIITQSGSSGGRLHVAASDETEDKDKDKDKENISYASSSDIP